MNVMMPAVCLVLDVPLVAQQAFTENALRHSDNVCKTHFGIGFA